MEKRRETLSKFLKVRCPKCKNEQIVFGNATSSVGCLVCSSHLTRSSGGKAVVKARILEVV